MKTIIDGKTAEVTEKKSRFIANIFHVENVTEADEKIKQINKKYRNYPFTPSKNHVIITLKGDY